jgi:hypothetical protein
MATTRSSLAVTRVSAIGPCSHRPLRGDIARVAVKTLDGGVFAQPASETVEGHLDPRTAGYSGRDAAHHAASVHSLERYARPGPEAVARYVAELP